MELRHLRYFVAVAEEEHMTRAAARLGIQQPPLSQQIRDLERELDVTLFDRTPRSVRLNANGRVFLKDARELLAAAEAAALRAQQSARGELGRIAIGYTSSASLHERVPRLIREFHAQYPSITLDVEENTTHDLLRAVAEEKLDAAFVRASSARHPALRSIRLCDEAMVVALPRAHPEARRPGPIALAALAAEDFVLYRKADGPGIRDALIAACDRAGFGPHVAEEVPRLLSAVTMVAAGRGVTIVPETLRTLHGDSVVYRSLDRSSHFTIPLNLVHRPVDLKSPLGRLVRMANRGRSRS